MEGEQRDMIAARAAAIERRQAIYGRLEEIRQQLDPIATGPGLGGAPANEGRAQLEAERQALVAEDKRLMEGFGLPAN